LPTASVGEPLTAATNGTGTRQVQRFLSTHDQIANVFSRRPTQDTAVKFRIPRNQALTTWAEAAGVAMAA
jgi:putative transposase